MRNNSNHQPSASNPPLPAAEPNTPEQEAKSKETVIIEARVKEALYPLNTRYKIVIGSKSAGKP
jgi:hypothetical protein